MRTYTRTALVAAGAFVLALTTACSTNDPDTITGANAGAVVLEDGWAKATDTDMSGVFGTIRNPGESDLHLTGVSGEVGGTTELHETVPGGSGSMMREKEDGFVIPAGGELVLEPGGNHIMLMDLDQPITTGQQITITLLFDDAVEQDITVSARDFQGGEEEYIGGTHEGTNHGG
ncbi:copper chaperone PCu(A)C [Dietzia sp. ANT_WB102]|uniref:copper chaperone PCu(A)C n=1 Tax=Dietzia sp. ANT_WB102 TaxID=2597345 RepID=UPI0011EC83B2|nr:copper chaperone PCu(A)C [Dietzia sp. ANT_WB102]KAA0918304.1 copper chaperone PCu(A)C [Dietzia sp. ANT_WB102]